MATAPQTILELDGSILKSSFSNEITGVNTSFLTSLSPGMILYDSVSGDEIGVVSSISSDTLLVLDTYPIFSPSRWSGKIFVKMPPDTDAIAGTRIVTANDLSEELYNSSGGDDPEADVEQDYNINQGLNPDTPQTNKTLNITPSQSGVDVASQEPYTAKASLPSKDPKRLSESAAEVDKEKYNFKTHVFPSDLMAEQGNNYGGNYAVFYINVTSEGYIKEGEAAFEIDPTIDPTSREFTVGKSSDKTSTLVANAGITAASGIIDTVTGVIDTSSSKGKNTGNLAKGLLSVGSASIGAVALGSVAPKYSRQTRRLTTAIALHMPNTFAIRYGTSWGTESSAYLSAAARAVSGVSNIGEVLSSDNVGKALTDLTKSGTEFGKNVLSHAVLNNAPLGGLSSALSIASNPKLTQTFQGVNFRSFTFDYTFYPRNEDEASNVMNIIHLFKLHMHPEFKGENDYVWIYPSEFDILYYHNHVENKKLHKQTTCILENMNVNYTPNGNYNTFPNGQPTQINVSLSFRELILASKETIGQNAGDGL